MSLWKFVLIFSLLSPSAYAFKKNLLGVSQGISAPTHTSTVNFSNGFTSENPLGTIYQEGNRVSVQGIVDDDTGGNDGAGFEIGRGNKTYGIAVGVLDQNCADCDTEVAASAAVTGDIFGVGISFKEDVLTIGAMFNPDGNARFGIVTNVNDSDESGNDVRSFGVGYTYERDMMKFTLDASKRDAENNNAADDVIMVSPGMTIQSSFVGISLSYDAYIDAPENYGENDTLWFGLGIGSGDTYHVALYSDYQEEWSASLSYYF